MNASCNSIYRRHVRAIVLAAIGCVAESVGASPANSQPQHQAPVPAQPASQPAAQPASARTTVWVNTSSGYYHRPDSRHYGKTRRGKYMLEADAVRAGYRLASN